MAVNTGFQFLGGINAVHGQPIGLFMGFGCQDGFMASLTFPSDSFDTLNTKAGGVKVAGNTSVHIRPYIFGSHIFLAFLITPGCQVIPNFSRLTSGNIAMGNPGMALNTAYSFFAVELVGYYQVPG
jgi:hypothetical protein